MPERRHHRVLSEIGEKSSDESFLIIGRKRTDERFGIAFHSRPELKIVLGGFGKRQIQQIKVDSRRTRIRTRGTADTSTCQVECPKDIPRKIPFERCGSVDPSRSVFIRNADITVTEGTILSAGVTLDTSGELFLPVFEPLVGSHCRKVIEFGITFALCFFRRFGMRDFAEDNITVRRLLDITGKTFVLQFPAFLNTGTGNSDDHHVVPVNLVFRFENGKRFCIAAFDDDAGVAQFFDLFLGQINGQVLRTLIVPKEPIRLVRTGNEHCSGNTAFELSEADDNTDFFVGQEFRRFFL